MIMALNQISVLTYLKETEFHMQRLAVKLDTRSG